MKTSRNNSFLALLGRFLGASAIVLSFSNLAHAVTLNWDTGSATGLQGGNGAWDTTTTNWNLGTGTTRQAWPNTALDNTAIFATTAGTVTLPATPAILANKITVNAVAYTITGGTLNLNGTAPTITSAANTTIASALTGTAGLIKAGAAYLTVSGNHSGLSGTTTINAGGLTMNTATNLNAVVVNTGGQFYGGWAIPGTTFANNFTLSGTGFVEGGINVSAIRATNNQTFSGPITLAANARIGMVEGGATASNYSGKISGAAALEIQGAFTGNAATQTITLANAGVANDYTGNTSLLAVGYGGVRAGCSLILKLGADNQIPDGAGKGNLVLSGANADNLTILELNGKSETINGISNASALGAIIRNSVSGASVLTIGGADTTGSFSGVISESVGTLALTKIGTAALTLGGVNTYTGPTTINAGTLVIDATGAIATSDMLVKSTAALQLTAAGKTLQRLALEDGSKLNLPVTAAQTITITNNLDLSSAPTNFTVKPVFTGTTTPGTYDLLTPGSISNLANLGVITLDTSGLSGRAAASSGVAIAGGKLVLTVGIGPASLVWDNVNGTGTGNWSVTTPADNNFKNGALDDQFYSGDSVSFTNTSAGSVALVGTVSPAAITVNSTTNYNFTGPGAIGGTTGLTKSGASTLTLSNAGPNTFTGVTELNLGTITAANPGALGTGSVTVNAGTLNLNAAGAASPATVTMNGGTLVLGAVGAITAPPAVVFGAGSTGKIQLNSYDLSTTSLNTNNFTGLQTIENGAATNSVLSLANTTANTFAGVLQDGSTGTLGFTKSGAGALYLQGAASNTLTGTLTLDVTGGATPAGVNHSLYLGKSGGAVAIPTNVIFGTNTTGQGNLRMQANNQFGSGGVMTFNNANSQWCRFDLAGTNQVLKGIVGGSTLSTTQVGAVIQNVGQDLLGSTASTLTLNPPTAPEDYYYYGYLRDRDAGPSATLQLNIIKDGLGKQTLAGNQILYTGPTTVNAGTLVFAKTSALATSITNNATVEIFANTGDDWILSNGKILSGSGTWNKTGAGRASLNNATSLMSGQINIQDGTLRNNNNAGNWTGSTADIFVGTTGILDLFADAIFVDQLTGTGFVQNGFGNPTGQTGSAAFFEKLVVGVAGGSSTFPGVVRNNATNAVPAGAAGGIDLEKVGAGEFTLSGANLYTGPTTVTGGMLSLSGGAAIVDTNTIVLANLAGAVLKLNASETIGAINGGGVTGGTINLQGNTLTLGGNNSSSSIAGAITGASGAITKLGTGVLTLSGANDYTGTTTISAGSLELSGTGTSNISLAATTSANITGSTTGALTVPDTAVVLGEGTVGSLNLGSVAGATINVNPTTAGALTATVAATVVGVNTVNLTNAGFTPGVPFTVMTFGSNANGFANTNFALANAASFRPATFAVSATQVTLVMGSLNLTWNNSDGSNAGKWDSSSTNFYDALASSSKSAAWGDFLSFNDAAAPNGPAGVAQVISVIGAQQPAAMTVSGATDYTFNAGASGAINGGTSLAKSGSGTLTMNLANGYTGGTTITGGVLTSTAAGSLGTGLITLSNGTLNANFATALGTAPVTVTGGTLNATVTNALGAGNIALNGGTLIPANVATPFGTATVAFGGGTLQYLATGTTTDVSANLKNSALPVRVDTNGNTATFGTALPATNTAGLTKIGAGNLTLGVAQAYLGGTSIEAGSITVAANNFPAAGTVAIGDAGTAILNTAGTTFTNAFSGNGLIQLNLGAGAVNNTYLTGVSTGFTGTLEVSGSGGNKLSHTAGATTSLNISPLALIKINSGATFYQTISIANPMQLVGTGNTENRGALRTGGGIVSGNISLLGNTTIGHEGSILSGSISGGAASPMTLTMGTSNSTTGTNISGNITDGFATPLAITFLNGTNTLGGTNAFTGGITLTAGSLTINGTNAAGSGNTAINGGTLNLNSAISGAGTLTMATGTTLAGEGSAPNITTVGTLNLTTNPGTSGALSTTGTLNIGGLTSVSLSGGAVPAGAIKVLEFGTAGTGLIASNFELASSASYRPGAAFTVNANDVSVTLANATLEWNNAGANLTWNTNATPNFRDTTTLANDKFFFGDHVIFGDLPGVAQTVAITGSQQVSSMSVNSQYNYTFTTGSITGGAALTKAGTGILFMNTANTFTSTLIKQGEMRSGNGASAGPIGTITLNDATTGSSDTAFLATAAQTIANPVVVANQGSGVVKLGSLIGTAGLISYNGTVGLNRPATLVGSGDRTTFNGKISGAVGTLTIDGVAGHRVTIGVGNDFVGNVVVNNGVIFQSDSPTSLPSATNLTLNGAAQYRLNGGGTHTINSLNAANPNSNVNIIAGGVSTLSLGNNNGSGVYNGIVSNNTAAISLVKNGSGTQSLLGANSYTGTTTINAGTLELSPVASYGAITVNDGAALSIVGSSTASLTTTALTLGTTGTTTLNISNFGNSLTEAPLKVSGALTANGTITANVTGTFTVGTYPLISYASGSLGGAGFAAFSLGTLPNGTSATLVNNTVNKSIDFVVTAAGLLTWDGTVNSQWDLATTNWLNPAAAKFVNADVVLFNDAATGSTNVVLNSALTPASVTFNNTSKTYTLSGTGSISGVAPILKTGTGLTTLTNTNTSTGLVTIAAGTLQLGDGTTNGSLAGNIATTANLIFNNAAPQSYAGNITGALGTVTKTGAGTLTLTGINSYTGGTTVSNGILQLGDAVQNGTAGIGTYSLAGGTTLFLNYASAVTVNGWSFGITGAGKIQLNSAQAVLGIANWGPGNGTATPLNPAFTGSLEVDRGRFDSSAVGMGGTTSVVIKDGAQFLGWSGTSYPQSFSIEGAGWGEANQLGSLRTGGGQSCVFNGNITLTNNASFNSQDTGSIMTLNGVIGGTGDLTRYNGGRINFYGSSSNTWTGGLILYSATAPAAAATTAAATHLVLGKTGGAVAIPANTVITFGGGVNGESNLRMEQNNQFGAGVVINSVNPSGGWSRFDLQGTSQTLAGINTGTASVAGGGIVQNRAFNDTTSAFAPATLTLNGSGSYLFNGFVRDADTAAAGTNLLNLVKSGSGTQVFAGTNILYTGTTTINGGTLQIPSRVTPYGDITLNSTGTLAIAGNPGERLITSTLTLNGASTLALNNFNSSGTEPCVEAQTGLATSGVGTVTLNVAGNFNAAGTYPLIYYPIAAPISGGGFGAFALGALPRSISASLVNNAGAGSVDLLISAVNPLTWKGNINSAWDINATSNWTLAAASQKYLEGDFVLFDDTATLKTVALNTPVSPYKVTINNSSGNDYLIDGSGGVAGTTNLIKDGTGKATLSTANSFTGGVLITAGILSVDDVAALGTTGVISFAGGTLQHTAANTVDYAARFSTAATQPISIDTNGQSVTYLGAISGTGSTLTKSGLGTLTLSGNKAYTGATTTSEGTLVVQGIPASTSYITASGAVLEWNVPTANRDTSTASYTGGGTLRKTGTFTLQWGGSAGTFAMASGALIDVQAGTMVGGSNANENWTANLADLNVAAGATFDGVEATVRVDALSGAGTIRTGFTGFPASITCGVDNGSGIFSGVIANSTNPGTLIKTGTGTQTLTGASTYSVATTISDGTLLVSNTSGSGTGTSAVTVGNAATLGGTGTITGAVTISSGGFINPGTVGTTGTLNVGASALSGSYTCDINGASADRINVTGALTATGSPSLDFNTVSAPTLPSYIIATYSTGTAPNVTNITGIPVGYVVDTATTGQIKLVSTYLTWAASKGLTGANNGLSDDPENDGISNLVEYYFDGDPLTNNQAILPQQSVDATYLNLTFKRRDDAEADVTSQIAQWGSTLTVWTPATITAATAAADANGVIITVAENGTAPDDVVVKIPLANAVGGKLFGRVVITK